MLKDAYLLKLLKSAKLQATSSEIHNAIEKDGEYVEYAEWRMGTCAEIKISHDPASEDSTYSVCVIYDYDFRCNCPTIERAIEMAGLFIQLIIKLDSQVGWPSNSYDYE